MIATLTLARHGESVFSHNGLVNGDPAAPGPLTAAGREQARRLGRVLADRAIDVCVTSEFERVRATAALALEGRNVRMIVVPELNDPAAGRFEGGPARDYGRWHAAAGWDEPPPGGGDSQLALVRRYVAGFRRVLGCEREHVLVVAHALPIGVALALSDPRQAPVQRRYDDDIALATPYDVSPPALMDGIRRAEGVLAAGNLPT